MKHHFSKTIVIMTALIMCSAAWAYAEQKMPQADPDALWTYITKTSPYKQWKFWPDHQGMQPGRAPHGPFHKVYVNDRLYNSSKVPVQNGSIEVKENYNRSKKLKVITVMYKVMGYNPRAGDWFWVKYSPDGRVGKYGKPRGCVGCHSTRAANDFILVHEFK